MKRSGHSENILGDVVGVGSLSITGTGMITATTRGAKERAVSQYADFNAALADTPVGGTLLLDAATIISATVTVPETILLQWVGCNIITVPDSITLTVLSSTRQWPTSQLFAFLGTGAFSFGTNKLLHDIQLEWFGGGINVTNNTPAFDRAMAAYPGTFAAVGYPIRLCRGAYKFTTNPLPINKRAVSIRGIGGLNYNASAPWTATTIACSAASGISFDFDAGSGIQHNGSPIIQDVNFVDANATQTLTLVRIRAFNRYVLERVGFANAAIGLQLDGASASGYGAAPCAGAIASGDASWGYITQSIFRNNNIGLDALNNAGVVIVGGDFTAASGGIGMHVHECNQQLRMLGSKFDGGAPALWVEGASNQFVGVNIERGNPGIRVGDGVTTYSFAYAASQNLFSGVHLSGSGSGDTGVLLENNSKHTIMTSVELSNFATPIIDNSSGVAGFGSNTFIDWRGITTDLPIRGQVHSSGVRLVTGSYGIAASDVNKLIVLTSAGSHSVFLPSATTIGFRVGAQFTVFNQGAGSKTIAVTTSTINGASSLVLAQNQGVQIVSDGTNYYYWR